MRIVFAHDHPFIFRDGHVFSTGKLPYVAFSRYLSHFDLVTVICREYSPLPATADLAQSDGPGVTFVPCESQISARRYWGRSAALRDKVRSVLYGADALVARLPSRLGLLALAEARRRGVPAAVELVGCPWDAYFYHGSMLAKFYAPAAYLQVRREVKRATHVIYVTNEFLQARYPNSGYASSASNVQLFELDNEVLVRRLRNIEVDRPNFTVGLIGSLNVAYKGHDLALQALRVWRSSGLNVKLQLVGPGDQTRHSKLAKRLGVMEYVEFLGVISERLAMANWLDSLDAYIQPSSQEGLPRATLEAFSRALPVATSSAGGLPEIVDRDFIHPVGNWKKLAEVVTGLILNKDLRSQQAKRNFAIAGDYSVTKLEQKRWQFWRAFREYIPARK